MIVENSWLHADDPVRSVTSKKTILSSRNQTSANEGRRESAPGRTLRFRKTTSILWIESARDMSDEEIDACYYQNRDYESFRSREKRMSRSFSAWSFMNGTKSEDLLGVETRMQRFHRRQRSKNAVFAVIFEQELRQENGRDAHSSTGDDDIILAQVYQQYTMESTRLAKERAVLNASQVERLTLRTNGSLMNDVETEEMNKETKSDRTANVGSPWQIPVSNRNKTDRNRYSEKVRYVSCSRPILPQQYSGMSTPDMKLDDQKESQDFRYEMQTEMQGRGSNYGSRRQEAPVQQQINRAEEKFHYRRPTGVLRLKAQDECQSMPNYATAKNNYAGTLAQKWMWNPNYCDLISPSSPVPRVFSWDLH